MAQATYQRVLPNLTQATRNAAYEKLSLLCNHLPNLGVDLVSISIDVPTRTITVVLTDPLRDDQLDHLGLI